MFFFAEFDLDLPMNMLIFSDLEEIMILTEVTLQTLEGLIDEGVY